MKRLLITTLLLGACSANAKRFVDKPADVPTESAESQQKAPEPLKFADTDPAVTVLGQSDGVQSYQVGGMTLIHKPTPYSPVVAARLYIAGGSRNLTPETVGIEQLALQVAISGGTESTPKEQFNALTDSTGSAIYSFTDRDYSGYGLKTLAQNFDKMWPLFVQSVVEPTMSSGEIELEREKQLAGIASLLDDPDSHTRHTVSQLMFNNHPYALEQRGTAATVGGFSRNQIVDYQRRMLDPSKMLLVVVGNVSTSDLINDVKQNLARIAPLTSTPLAAIPPFTSAAGVANVDRELPTNYILGYHEGPAPGDPDYAAMLVATEYLRDRLFEEVRTKRNLTYAVSSGLTSKLSNYGYLYVTAVDPEKTMKVIFDQISELKLLEIPRVALEETINVFVTSYYMRLETNGEQAGFLGHWQMTTGAWQNSQKLLNQIKAVTPSDVQRVAQKYMTNYRFGVVGKPGAANPAWYKAE